MSTPSTTRQQAIRTLAAVCLKNSRYDFVQGGRGGDYVDVDQLFAEPSDGDMAQVLDLLVDKINQYHAQQPLSAVAFVERDSGPVGLVASRHWIASRCGLPTLVVRPQKRIARSAIKGSRIEQGDLVALVTDVATTGRSIVRAANVVWQAGGRVAVVIPLVDRECGARELLKRMDLDLDPVESISTLREANASLTK